MRGVTLAHPLTESVALPLPPAVVGLLAVLVVWAVGAIGRSGASTRPHPAPAPVRPGSLTVTQWLLRGAGALLLVATVVVGMRGPQDQLRNPVPALVVGVAWPMLVGAAAAGVDVWRRVNGIDALARLVQRFGAGDGDEEPRDVHPAVVASAAWLGYLALHGDPLRPSNVAVAVGAYVFVALAGSLAVGRVAWLSRWEALGVLTSWLDRPAALTGRRFPRGSSALVGVVYAGTLLPSVVRSDLLGAMELADRGRVWWAVVGISLAGTIGLALGWTERQLASQGAGHAVVAIALPALAGLVVAMALTAGRLTTSVQVLVRLATGGSGAIYPYLLDAPTIAVVQVVITVVGHAAGALVLRRAAHGRPRQRAVAVLASFAAASVLLTTAPFG